jgi:hypothetical protein
MIFILDELAMEQGVFRFPSAFHLNTTQALFHTYLLPPHKFAIALTGQHIITSSGLAFFPYFGKK